MDNNHKRALESGLLIIERYLHNIEIKLMQKDRESKAILYFVSDDLKLKTKEGMLKVIPLILNDIRQIKKAFELETRKESARRQFYGELSEMWVILEDLMPEKLEAYGKVSKTDRERLRPHILKRI
jgi:hypothetical protein